MAMPATTRWTADMVRALTLGRLLWAYIDQHTIGDVLLAPADVLTAKHVMVEPDVFVVPLVEGRKPGVVAGSGETPARDQNSVAQLRARRSTREAAALPARARAGVLDRRRGRASRRAVAARGRTTEILPERIEWRPDPGRPPLVIDLAAYFRDVIGE